MPGRHCACLPPGPEPSVLGMPHALTELSLAEVTRPASEPAHVTIGAHGFVDAAATPP